MHFLQLSNIKGFEFKHILLKRSGVHDFYYFLCCQLDGDDIALDDSQGLLKKFRNLDTAMKTAETIIKNNVVADQFVRVQPKAL